MCPVDAPPADVLPAATRVPDMLFDVPGVGMVRGDNALWLNLDGIESEGQTWPRLDLTLPRMRFLSVRFRTDAGVTTGRAWRYW